MTSIRLQDVGDIPLGTNNGKNPFERVRKEPHRSDRLSGGRETAFSDAGSRKYRLTPDGEEALTCTPATCPYPFGEHGLAFLAECGDWILPLLRWNCYAGIIRRRLKQHVCDCV
ncbi:hypothetical protein [Methanoculleus sp. MH98A]|uniref:hypothetical protein n=1 Tax=Methanoculleus sp. MH98A TaxID=1495314 RepID=UPI0004A14C16|nr:hypothetical protein [Methanoculleus sp. MH98A]KDE54968.1 hypothetical protein EI28_10395 [Methanoculleus sp. MH98A]